MQAKRDRDSSTGSFHATNVNLASVEAEFAANYDVDLSRVTTIRFRDVTNTQEVEAVFILNDGESSVSGRLSFQEQVQLEGYLRKRYAQRRADAGLEKSVEVMGTMEDRMFRQENEMSKLKDRVEQIYYSPGMPGAVEAQEQYNAKKRRSRD